MSESQKIVDLNELPRAVPAGAAPAAVPAVPMAPTPLWVQSLRDNLGRWAKGFAFAVAQTDGNGVTTTFSQTANLSRSMVENPNPGLPWTSATRCNLASVSKFITGAAMVKFMPLISANLDSQFWPLIQGQFPSTFQPGQGVASVTLGQLLTMKSGMEPNGALTFNSILDFLTEYLAKPLTAAPGVEQYSNTNFTILQDVIEYNVVKNNWGTSYVDWVTRNILRQMGIAQTVFNATPDLYTSATLYYRDSTDCKQGAYWLAFNAVAAGGWVSSADQLLQFLVGLRSNAALTSTQVEQLLTMGLGCYAYNGKFGTYYHHNGGLIQGDPGGWLRTGVVRFSQGFDAVLLCNSAGDPDNGDPIALLTSAFEKAPSAVYRYSAATGAHFFCTDPTQEKNILSSGWTPEGVHFYAFATPEPGTVPVYRYVKQGSVLRRYTILGYGNPNAFPGWTLEKTAWYTPYNNGCPQPGVVPLLAYTLNSNPDIFFYTSNPSQENLTAFSPVTGPGSSVGMVYDGLAVPVFRYYESLYGSYLYTIDPSQETLNGWYADGIKFYAFGTAVPGTVPVYRYLNANGWVHLYSLVSDASTPNWTFEGIAFYIYPSNSLPDSTVPLLYYRSNPQPTLLSFITSTPQWENVLSNYTEVGPMGYVYNGQYFPNPPFVPGQHPPE
jgi:hypothetical protein